MKKYKPGNAIISLQLEELQKDVVERQDKFADEFFSATEEERRDIIVSKARQLGFDIENAAILLAYAIIMRYLK